MFIKNLCSSLSLDGNLEDKSHLNVSEMFRDKFIMNHTLQYNNLFQFNNSLVLQKDFVKLIFLCKNVNKIDFMKLNLIKFIYPILFLFGIFGNSISLIVMIKKYKSKNAKSNNDFFICLGALCFSDLVIIIFGCFREFLDEIFNASIRSHSKLSCRILMFVCYLFSSYTSYLIAFIAW